MATGPLGGPRPMCNSHIQAEFSVDPPAGVREEEYIKDRVNRLFDGMKSVDEEETKVIGDVVYVTIAASTLNRHTLNTVMDDLERVIENAGCEVGSQYVSTS